MKKIILLLLMMMPFMAAAQEVYHIKFTSSGVHYSVGVVVFSDDTGVMRVRYDAGDGEKIVQMDVEVTDTDTGFTVYGSNPVNAYTDEPASYNADNFYVKETEDGDITCKNVDDKNSQSECCIMSVEGDTNQYVFLREFGWEFDD